MHDHHDHGHDHERPAGAAGGAAGPSRGAPAARHGASHEHGHGHSHGHAAGTPGVRKALTIALVLNAAFLVIEAGAGWLTGSLALLSDAAHMVSDVGALALALGATHLAERRGGAHGTFGFRRAETIGAFVNGLLLLAACAWIATEAVGRLLAGPPEVPGLPVFVVAAAGLVVNVGSAWWLARADRDNLNVRGALLHMLADAVGSVGAMIAAGLLLLGYPLADPVVSLLIAAMVLFGSWGLLRDATRVLLQFAPAHLDVPGLRTAMAGVPGVVDVHDLHVWTLDGQRLVLSAHLEVADTIAPEAARLAASTLLSREFGIDHSTLQVERGEPCSGGNCDDA